MPVSQAQEPDGARVLRRMLVKNAGAKAATEKIYVKLLKGLLTRDTLASCHTLEVVMKIRQGTVDRVAELADSITEALSYGVDTCDVDNMLDAIENAQGAAKKLVNKLDRLHQAVTRAQEQEA